MNSELEPSDIQSGPGSRAQRNGPPPQSRWLRVGMGLLAVILILALVGPDLRDQFLAWIRSGDGSITELEGAAAADPGNETLQYQLGGAYYRAFRFDEAWVQFRVVETYRLAADAHPEIADAEQAVQATSSSKEAHFQLGTALARVQLLLPAEIAFQQAIALDDRYADAHANLGVVYYQMNRLPDALREYDAVLATNSDDAEVRHNKGVVYVQQALQATPPDDALLDQGLREFQHALEIEPDLPQAHFSLGVVYTLQGKSQEAIAEFQRFLSLDDGSDPEATTAARSYLTQLGQ